MLNLLIELLHFLEDHQMKPVAADDKMDDSRMTYFQEFSEISIS